MIHPIEAPCPTCGAVQGQRCVGAKGRERVAFHRARGSRRGLAPAEHGHRVDSPIENDMVAYIRAWLDHNGIKGPQIATQVPVPPYRADIVVSVGSRKLVVECDGAAFHNGADAVQRDKRRDRFFAIAGYAVMRFTGHEITRDPRGCAAEVGAWILAQ